MLATTAQHGQAPRKFYGWHNVGLLLFVQFAASGFVYFAYSVVFPVMVETMQTKCLWHDSLGNWFSDYFEALLCAQEMGVHYVAVRKPAAAPGVEDATTTTTPATAATATAATATAATATAATATVVTDTAQKIDYTISRAGVPEDFDVSNPFFSALPLQRLQIAAAAAAAGVRPPQRQREA